jgi:hypothetical protein
MKLTSATRLLALAAMMAVTACIGSSTAMAAPKLGVTLNRTLTPLTHGDERTVYEVTVSNVASEMASVGEEISCSARNTVSPTEWFNVQTFSFQWLSNGAAATGPTTQPTASTSTYVVQSADAGHALQCLVLGENPNATIVSFTPPLQVEPGSSPLAARAQPSALNVRPTIAGAEAAIVGETRTCSAPEAGAWSESPSWGFRWLRNGAPITGATSAGYEVTAADSGKVLQCEVIGVTGSGEPPNGATVVAISKNLLVGVSGAPNNNPAIGVSELPFLSFSHTTSGPVTLEVQLPGGQETYAYRALGTESGTAVWSCGKEAPSLVQPATVTCTRSDPLVPGSSYPAVEVVERPGRDAPDTLTTKATASGGGATETAVAEDSFTVDPAIPFGFEGFFAKAVDSLGNDYTKAGGHPFAVTANVQFTEHVPAEENATNAVGLRALNGRPRIVSTETPRGFVGNPLAVKACPTVAQVLSRPPSCPLASVVGGITLETSEGDFPNEPVYEVEPEFGAPAQFAFGIAQLNLAYTLTPQLNPEDGYAIQLLSSGIPKSPELFAAPVTLCGFGAKPMVPVRIEELEFQGCRNAGQVGANLVPFLTNPTRCEAQGPVTRISADTWEDPGTYAEATYAAAPLTECDQVHFEPNFKIKPTSNRADAPTGLEVELSMPTRGLEEAGGTAQANLAGATVTLPEGMAVNPSLASNLQACTEAQFGMHHGVPDDQPVRCPEASKIGTAEVRTPLISDPLTGNVYVAAQGDNPFGSLLALYMELGSKRDGLLLKVAGKVTPDPQSGQLTTTFAENPQAPFSQLKLRFAEGPRAPLINPPSCGRYAIHSTFWPWTAADPAHPTGAETVSETSSFQVARGPGGGACPDGVLEPHLSAGVKVPLAGATSPFVLDLSRPDGSQRFRAVDVQMPPGLTAYLRGVPYCPDSALASISSAEGTAAAQNASPACPLASQIGTVTAGAGAGEEPFFLQTGKAYLAGPYKGAPLSIAIVTPALAGPFDLGSVVVRSGLYVDLETAQVTVKSDPIPTILHGLPLDVRDIRVNIDRPNFVLAPTNCEPMAVAATVFSPGGESAGVSNRFQVGGCDELKFKPHLKLQLKGSTKRSGHPALDATVTYPKRGAYANIAGAQVSLPHSEFLDQGNLDKVCTQPQLRSATCPKGSVYGHARAWTPLLEKPLEGPVYIGVGYGHKLPDLVADLNGQIRILLHGRIDTTKQEGIRTTFEVVPDAPVSRFLLEMKGGKKYGLLENSENICRKAQRANARFAAQNGRIAQFRPTIDTSCKGHESNHAHRHRGG